MVRKTKYLHQGSFFQIIVQWKETDLIEYRQYLNSLRNEDKINAEVPIHDLTQHFQSQGKPENYN